MKCCSKCKNTKPEIEFGKRKASKDGLDGYCKSCRQEYYKNKNYDRKQYQSNYIRTITQERKCYLKEYNLKNQFKYYTPKNKISFVGRTSKETKAINKLVWRTLIYKNEDKLKQSKHYLGWTKSCFINKFGNIPDNYHIDHKIPVSWFIKDTPVYIINSLDNLQLLSAIENITKGNKFSHPISNSYYSIVKDYVNETFLDKINIMKD